MAGGAGPQAFAGAVEVDAPTARELLEEAHAKITREEIAAVVDLLEVKARAFQARLGPDAIATADERVLREILRSVFVSRRRVGAIFGARPAEQLRETIARLLHGDDPAHERLAVFCGAIELPELAAAASSAASCCTSATPPAIACARASSTTPTRAPARCRCSSARATSSRATASPRPTSASSRAMRSVDASPEAASFRPQGGGALATDVFLACVYGVYMSTVLGLKMSREFNSLIPPLPQLARRLLGVHKMEV